MKKTYLKQLLIPVTLMISTSLLAACANHHPKRDHEHEHENAQFTPGLGEIMAQTANRHVKLWFAGQAQNWDLAAYELDELDEGFVDAGKYHRTHKDIKESIPDLITQNMSQPLAALAQAVKDKNLAAFSTGYTNLTVACNTCHQATEFGFNIVAQPKFNPFANQVFEK